MDSVAYGLVGGVIAAIGIAIVNIITARSKAAIEKARVEADIKMKETESKARVAENESKLESLQRKDTIIEWQEYASQATAHAERQDATIRQLQTQHNLLMAEHLECREESAEQYATLMMLHDQLIRQNQVLKELGKDVGEVKPIPPRRVKRTQAELEFAQRQLSQSSVLVQEAGKIIKPPEQNASN